MLIGSYSYRLNAVETSSERRRLTTQEINFLSPSATPLFLHLASSTVAVVAYLWACLPKLEFKQQSINEIMTTKAVFVYRFSKPLRTKCTFMMAALAITAFVHWVLFISYEREHASNVILQRCATKLTQDQFVPLTLNGKHFIFFKEYRTSGSSMDDLLARRKLANLVTLEKLLAK